MQSTISLKIDTEAVPLIKKVANLRNVSMSDLVREAVYKDVNYKNKNSKNKQSELLKYFGFIKTNTDVSAVDEVFNNIKEGRKDLNIKNSQQY
jgi:hypothetical protein